MNHVPKVVWSVMMVPRGSDMMFALPNPCSICSYSLSVSQPSLSISWCLPSVAGLPLARCFLLCQSTTNSASLIERQNATRASNYLTIYHGMQSLRSIGDKGKWLKVYNAHDKFFMAQHLKFWTTMGVQKCDGDKGKWVYLTVTAAANQPPLLSWVALHQR